MADATWTHWSKFQERAIVRDNATLLTRMPENWDITMRFPVAVNYHY